MNRNRTFSLPLIAGVFAIVATMAHVQPMAAQQSTDVFPVANTTSAPVAGATPDAFSARPVNVESPPAANAPIETEILATQGANFASKERIAVFEGDVRVNDPRFQLACDRLTVYLAKGAADGIGPAAPTPTPAAKSGDNANGPGGGIDHAHAEGHVIIIQKRAAVKAGEEPKISRGHADQIDFDNKTGDMVLRGTPSVEQNGNTHVALSPSTVMTLHKDNSMNTQGPSRTVFTSKSGGADLPGATPAPAKPAGGKGGNKPRKGGASQG